MDPIFCAIGICVGCGRVMGFNPDSVPSAEVDGELMPICEGCIAAKNRYLRLVGVPTITIAPDAYDPIPEAVCR